eukprot:1149403-Pelagomonas_calceolata.AAC.5
MAGFARWLIEMPSGTHQAHLYRTAEPAKFAARLWLHRCFTLRKQGADRARKKGQLRERGSNRANGPGLAFSGCPRRARAAMPLYLPAM